MKKFKFSLHKLLDMKASNLEILKIEISKLNGEIAKIKEKIEAITEEISKSQKKMDKGVGSVRVLKEWMNYIHSMYLRRGKLSSQLFELEKHLDELKEKYVELYKEHKALENLRKIRENMHNLDMLREEQKVIDDLAISRKNNVSS